MLAIVAAALVVALIPAASSGRGPPIYPATAPGVCSGWSVVSIPTPLGPVPVLYPKLLRCGAINIATPG